ncbi:TIGR02117 family protein [Hoeflea sp. BAL378]|uniref:TIGR02117 family protein n=1 Tax=Hoeflea sp. BAL378 TaxID=1547437 RepID=UPI00068B619B|nr:TIGR02117 family protein [Hoeflea sp. BAL378]
MRYLFGAVLITAVALGLGTLLPRPLLPSGAGAQAAGEPSQPATRTVLVLSSAIHTDLALPASPDIVERFGFMAGDGLDPGQPGVAYVLAGWGSRAFYIETPTWSELKPGPLFKALTLDRSVMHIGLGGDIDPAHPSVTELELDEASFEALVRAVLASFSLDGGGRRIVVPDSSYGEYDLFYEAEGSFNALAGCNVWTAAVLRQAGLTTGWWTPLPGLLTASLRLHNGDGVRD